MPDRTAPLNSSWVVVTFKDPVLWGRTDDEMWSMSPHRRYVLNQNQIESLRGHVEKISDLKGSGNLRPLDGSVPLRDAHLLVERYRDRGVGDLLFLSGPLQYLHDMSGNTATIDFYSLLDRASVLRHHPALRYGPLSGPVHYDDLPHFTAHWFIDNATEHVEEPDQPNVYDTLYRQIGINPAHVAPRYKRPVVGFSQADWQDLQSIYATCHAKEGVDLRVLPYVILAPCAYSSLRAAPYQMWLNLAQQLSEKYTVIFVGRTSDEGQLPIPDITFGEFYQRLVTLAQQSKHRIINLIGPTPLRPIMALIARSLGIVALDSGLLYVAQASRVPAVSLWGTHAPHTRLLYDPAYMRGAIWKRDSCKHSPCFAYAGFPVDRCPTGPGTRVCNVLATITSEEVVERLERVLNDENGARPPEPIIQPEIAKPAVGQVDVKS